MIIKIAKLCSVVGCAVVAACLLCFICDTYCVWYLTYHKVLRVLPDVHMSLWSEVDLAA